MDSFLKITVMRNKIFCCGMLLLSACTLQTQDANSPIHVEAGVNKHFEKIGEIPVPDGYSRVEVKKESFGEWLRMINLKKDNRVFLYNGSLKSNQSAQFAVLDMPVGNRDLQQCADAVMRLNAEYLLSINDLNAICFHATDGTLLSFTEWRKGKRYKLAGNKLVPFFVNNQLSKLRSDFENYLETVFTYAGTTSLSRELITVNNISDIEPGYVFIKPGFPGHAMIVVDVAENNKGEKLFMLAQSYMPAQDIHLVKNPANEDGNPWYRTGDVIATPEWTFTSGQLKKKQ